MDLNSKYLVIKLPADVRNCTKAIEALGNRDNIHSKVIIYLYSVL